MDAPFDSTNIGVRERPLSSDHNQQAAQFYRTMRELARYMLSPRASDSSSALASQTGFLGDGLRIVPSSPNAMSVQVSAGLGFLVDPIDVPGSIGSPDLEQVKDLSPFKPLSLVLPSTFAVPAAPGAPNTRIDIIEARNGRRLTDALTRRQLDIGTLSYLDHVFNKTLAYGLDGQTGVVTSPAASTAALSYKIGVPGNPGVVPTTTPGYTKLGEIALDSTITGITGTEIVDRRALLGIGGLVHASAVFRVLWNAGAPTISAFHVQTPPGIEFRAFTSAGFPHRGDFTAHFYGGQITGVVSHATVMTPINTLAAAGGEVVAFTPADLGVQQTTTKTNISNQQIGIGQTYVNLFNANGVLHFRDASGVASITNAKLEDLTFNWSVALRYW